MAARYMPKTLAKTLTYILCHSPGEHGLFWNPDGTMPWRELYWALQEDPSLRFVRETHFKELAYLGIELPAFLEGNVLKLGAHFPAPSYPVVEQPPERLYHACRRKHYAFLRQHGLTASGGRPFVPLASDKELALRLGRRRDPDPILIEVAAKQASIQGALFYRAGPHLYLVASLPVESLVLPLLRAEDALAFTAPKKRDKTPAKPDFMVTPGSFLMSPDHLRDGFQPTGSAGKGREKGKKGEDWKRQSRKERHKRKV